MIVDFPAPSSPLINTRRRAGAEEPGEFVEITSTVSELCQGITPPLITMIGRSHRLEEHRRGYGRSNTSKAVQVTAVPTTPVGHRSRLAVAMTTPITAALSTTPANAGEGAEKDDYSGQLPVARAETFRTVARGTGSAVDTT